MNNPIIKLLILGLITFFIVTILMFKTIHNEPHKISATKLVSSQETLKTPKTKHPVPDHNHWLTYKGKAGPGSDKHIVLITADQEYRSEESMPMLAKVLSEHHGFHTTVLFGMNDNYKVDPTLKVPLKEKGKYNKLPGLEHLKTTDLVILITRYTKLSPRDFEHITQYIDDGKPIIALRTANHGFWGFPYKKDGKRVRFGEDILGGSFRKHHGRWQKDSTRGILVDDNASHPILKGVKDIWGPSDVYRTYKEGTQLPEGCTPLVMGQPLMKRTQDSAVNTNLIPLPVAWVKTWTGNKGKTNRIFHFTMGSAKDFENEGVRRITVNAAYWCLGLENSISATSNVNPIGEYKPKPSSFNYKKIGVIPREAKFYK